MKLAAELLTPEGMTLAERLVRDGRRGKADVLDDAYNRWTWSDKDKLPQW